MKISNRDLLSHTSVASPCPASWEAMSGDDKVRFCSECKLNVYNLSEMSKTEAEKLLRSHEGDRLCIRLYLRADGTIITQDCPVGIRLLKIRTYKTWKKLIATAASVLGMASQAGAQNAGAQPQHSPVKTTSEFVVAQNSQPIAQPSKLHTEEADSIISGRRRIPDYGPYMKALSSEITKNWHPNEALVKKHNAAKVMFKVLQDQRIVNVKLLKSSGNNDLDKQALACFAKLKKMPIPLPVGSDDSIDIEFSFDDTLLKQIKAEK